MPCSPAIPTMVAPTDEPTAAHPDRQPWTPQQGLELRTPQQRLELRMMTIPGEGGHELGSKHGTHFSIESEQKAHIIASVWSDWSSVLGPQL